MQKLISCCTTLLFFVAATAQTDLVNPIIGNTSFIEKFGYVPDNSVDEKTRITTHLEYAEQQLRVANISDLTEEQRENRGKVLDLLHQYIINGIFPHNYDYPGERKPCFIDRDGDICAVGYLVEQTAGRSVAEDINSRHQYDKVMDMHEETIEAWATTNGLTVEECAMIQPTYGPAPGSQTIYADIKTGYGISSGIVSGGNLAVNAIQLMNPGKGNKTLSYVGLATGAGQIIMGLTNIRKSSMFYYGIGYPTVTSYKNQNNLSYINIAMGTSTIVTSTLNLIMNKKNKDRRNAFNLYSYPDNSNTLTMGLSFTRKI
jgi:hypothetical protein